MAENRQLQQVVLSNWTGGINSLLPPWGIAKQQYAWGENVINRGGIIQTRPGRKVRASIAGTNPQGACVFTPTGADPVIVAAVDGLIYTLSYPSYTPVQVQGIQFDANAKQIHFCQCVRSVMLNPDNSLKLIPPTNILMMQDGVTEVAYWDGTNAAHIDPKAPQAGTPIGTWMAYIMDRLWIASGSQVFVCDLSNPLNHTEAIYLSERDAFQLPDVCTGMVVLPNRSGLLVFCRSSTTSFQANISDRTTWSSTPNFQSIVLQNVGCIAGKTIVNQYGLTYWMSDKGLVGLDDALSANRSSRLIAADTNMLRSRRKLAPDMSGCCAINWGNFLLVSVPSGGLLNEHTWVLDQEPAGNASIPVWASNWTGTRPVEWASGTVGGKQRLFQLSYDKSELNATRIHIWEDMLDSRQDDGGPIQCCVVTGAATFNDLMRFRFARIEAVEVLGNVSMTAYMAGLNGPMYPIGSFQLQAEEGCFGSPLMPFISNDSVIQAYKPQSRALSTLEFSLQDKAAATSEQGPFNPGMDQGFYMCLSWLGRFGVREMTMYFGPGAKTVHGFPSGADGANGAESNELNGIDESGVVVPLQTT